MTVTLRPARSLDAGAVGEILHGFARENDWMPELHTGAEAIAFCGRMIDKGWVTVAEQGGKVAGFLAVDGTEVHCLYLSPAARNQGIGTQLLDSAKAGRRELALYAFQANTGARRFYERHGFVEVARSNGADNDEQLPDIRFVWRKKE
ncbi:GNAT family N-acetyltransferase [Ruegeria arenilitoris]|uniref:GNAT family N-acetyltransferase n=1 Tax=Ruegeria arenilitoris TaxID=1173585 RepID=UPI001C989E95|nr:GNAT family N-acetyltransferase [Ruegeria arenilitoris]MBY6082009.1 GNAT family N-acetyltransferase [Ruegeria arenilitoris]